MSGETVSGPGRMLGGPAAAGPRSGALDSTSSHIDERSGASSQRGYCQLACGAVLSSSYSDSQSSYAECNSALLAMPEDAAIVDCDTVTHISVMRFIHNWH